MNVLKLTDQIAPMAQPVLIHGGVRNVFALEIAMDRRVNIVRADMLPLPIFTVQTIKLLTATLNFSATIYVNACFIVFTVYLFVKGVFACS